MSIGMEKSTPPIYIFTLLLFFTFPFHIPAQPLSYIPGPANVDTSRFAHVYFLREEEDEFPDNWMAAVMNNDNGFCVKAKMNHIYRVNTVRTGLNRFGGSIDDVKTEITLYLRPGENSFVELKPLRQPDNSIRGNIRVLDDAEGEARVKSFTGTIQDRYCILPFGQEHFDYRENAYEDTIRWYAGKDYFYLFKPLPSWEMIGRTVLFTSLTFRNELISKTYSEARGIYYLALSKCNSEAELATYCKEKFIHSAIVKGKDSLISAEVKSIQAPEGIRYAMMVNIENRTASDKLPDAKSLTLHASYIVFFWTNRKGKGEAAFFYDSERGLPEELHSLAELEERMRWAWKSFRLVEED